MGERCVIIILSFHKVSPSPMKEQPLPSRQTCLIEAINDSVGKSLNYDASFVDCSDRKRCRFIGGRLVDTNSSGNDPYQHIDERVC